MKKQIHDKTHLTLDERKIIQTGIESNSTKAAIAATIAKDATTIAKEIRNHRKLRPRNTFNSPFICKYSTECKKGCVMKCERYEEPICKRRDRSPGACNKCPSSTGCRLDKYIYNAVEADAEYRRDLVDFREGINLTTKGRDAIAQILAPLLKNGQSVHQILSAHNEICQSERTIYNYIESGVFKDFGIDNFSLKEQVNRKQFKGKYKKRKEPVNYSGRSYKDYQKFREENPDVPTIEMDTVMNSVSGPYIQTLIFENTGFMIGFLHKEKTSAAMSSVFNQLQDQLGEVLFSKLFSLILTDRGSEFEKNELFELNPDGTSRLRIFYCDPMQSAQKPHVENNHNYVRDVIPNGYPMDSLAQKDMYLMFSHINSTPRKSLGDKSPYEILNFMYGENTAEKLNIVKIERDDVILAPHLLFANRKR